MVDLPLQQPFFQLWLLSHIDYESDLSCKLKPTLRAGDWYTLLDHSEFLSLDTLPGGLDLSAAAAKLSPLEGTLDQLSRVDHRGPFHFLLIQASPFSHQASHLLADQITGGMGIGVNHELGPSG